LILASILKVKCSPADKPVLLAEWNTDRHGRNNNIGKCCIAPLVGADLCPLGRWQGSTVRRTTGSEWLKNTRPE
jgi:hypothetical protein